MSSSIPEEVATALRLLRWRVNDGEAARREREELLAGFVDEHPGVNRTALAELAGITRQHLHRLTRTP